MNKIDKAVVYVPKGQYVIVNFEKYQTYIQSYDRFKSLKINLTKSEALRIEFTGKLIMKSNELWLWDIHNISLCPKNNRR